jgi:hypothetical protein
MGQWKTAGSQAKERNTSTTLSSKQGEQKQYSERVRAQISSAQCTTSTG